MQYNRFGGQPELAPFSPAVAAIPAAGAFLICPTVLSQGYMGPAASLLAVYERAFECAEAVVRPSLIELLQIATAN
jgi:hypothetical protein